MQVKCHLYILSGWSACASFRYYLNLLLVFCVVLCIVGKIKKKLNALVTNKKYKCKNRNMLFSYKVQIK